MTNIIHITHEELKKICISCNKNFKSVKSYKSHMYSLHKQKIIKNQHHKKEKLLNKLNNDLNNNNTKIIIDEVKESKEEIKEEIKEVKQVVNKAISKASSLIKYLMEHHPNTPPLKKINETQCMYRLRLDYNCPHNPDDKYKLEKKLIDDYTYNNFVENICKIIRKLIKYDTNINNHTYESIYNTDVNRYNYVVKINDNDWNEDVAGKIFCKLVINPLLNTITPFSLKNGTLKIYYFSLFFSIKSFA